MRNLFLLFIFLVSYCSVSQVNLLKKNAKKAKELLYKKQDKLSEKDIVIGLKEALKVASTNSINLASKKGGFTNNLSIRIDFPKNLSTLVEDLNKIGMSNKIERFELQMNVAAEQSSSEVLSIFLNIIDSLTFTEARNILHGSENEAARYLRSQSYENLFFRISPIVKSKMNELKIYKSWNILYNRYNSLPFSENQDFDLENYIVEKTIDGIFILISEQERLIRKDPSKRINDILKRIFN
ncbi:MAG: hypothetical protein CMP51_01745 [Flavobacteriales bacterium]|nr:hypothetical protein [Flavobacteriales bacterium]|tara:strand:+ start:1593 stop:2312 length:720 start_codon:yes stop_codon:yes gene_type:complete